ncbi:MAG: 6-carboxytetrahydropterin synthase QueD [Thermodesulfobacteriota bacterium]|nr:6-carboxytetrahydropterin synthase QueD [Thermodesulfobacteriota bacterium]
MFDITIKTDFSSAHSLRNYNGECEEVHGHNFKISVTVSGEELDDVGIAIDFKILKEKTNRIISYLDHKNLNDLAPFKEINPSSENIALYIYKEMDNELKGEKVSIKNVAVWESDSSCAVYYR